MKRGASVPDQATRASPEPASSLGHTASVLRALADRCEAAGGDQAALLRETFEAIHGPKPPRIHGGTEEMTAWLALFNPFYRMLEAKAYESAAMTLLPDELTFLMVQRQFRGFHVEVGYDCAGNAITAALAICAATLRARAA